MAIFFLLQQDLNKDYLELQRFGELEYISDIQAYKIHNILKLKDYTNASNKLTRCCGIKNHKKIKIKEKKKKQDRKNYKYIYLDLNFKYFLIT